MKKLLSILLCVAMLCTICVSAISCNKQEQNDAQTPPTEDNNTPGDNNTPDNSNPEDNNNPDDNNEPEIRYTVTEEEWESFIDEKNYTSEVLENGVRITFLKRTDNATQLDEDTIILYEDDNQYILEKTEEGWFAHATAGWEDAHMGALETYDFVDFEYSETEKAYLYKYWEDYGVTFAVRFENGVLVSVTEVEVDNPTRVLVRLLSDIGTTVITIPEYELVGDPEIIIPPPVSEEVWNSYAFETNFTVDVDILGIGDFYMEKHCIKSTGDALMIDDDIYVLINNEYYLLEETADGWIATKSELPPFYLTTLLDSFSFNEFEYEEDSGIYTRRRAALEDPTYYVSFDVNGVLESYSIFGNNPWGYPDVAPLSYATVYTVVNVGSTVIEIPPYTVVE